MPDRMLPCDLWLRFSSPFGTLWTVCLWVTGCCRITTSTTEIECTHWVTSSYPLGASWDWIYSSECFQSMNAASPRFRTSKFWRMSCWSEALQFSFSGVHDKNFEEVADRTNLDWTGTACHAFGGSLSKLEGNWLSLECHFAVQRCNLCFLVSAYFQILVLVLFFWYVCQRGACSVFHIAEHSYLNASQSYYLECKPRTLRKKNIVFTASKTN